MSGGWRPPPFPFEIEDRGEIWIDESFFLGNSIESDLIFLSNRTESELKKKKIGLSRILCIFIFFKEIGLCRILLLRRHGHHAS